MRLYTADELRAANLRPRQSIHANLTASYVVTRDVLAIELSTLLKPKLVTIPAKSVVELPGAASLTGFVELTWQGKEHLIFEADRSRLEPNRKPTSLRAGNGPHPTALPIG